MKHKILILLSVVILLILIFGLAYWALYVVTETEHKISITGIIAVIITAIISVANVAIVNANAKKQEFDLLYKKETQNTFEHFHNALVSALQSAKEKNKNSQKEKQSNAEAEMFKFKKGLMSWGSKDLIQSFYTYESDLKKGGPKILEVANTFLKVLRKEMGFNDPDDLDVFSILLVPEDRV
ncbi:MAG: hypothetical protein QNL04_08885 [SAR324 cluster bacterium]|nr:hypothetical protein [SAR324 cluster bacterium]